MSNSLQSGVSLRSNPEKTNISSAGVVLVGKEKLGEMVLNVDYANLTVKLSDPYGGGKKKGMEPLHFSTTRIVNLSFPGSRQGFDGADPYQKIYSILFLPDNAQNPGELRVLRFRNSSVSSVSPKNAEEEEGDQQQNTLDRLFLELEEYVYPEGGRKMIAFVSPVSGKGEGLALFNKFAVPLIQESRHTLHVINTTHKEHATEWCRELRHNIQPHDVIIAAGGDGMLFEVINGLKQRQRLAHLKKQSAEWQQQQQEAHQSPPRNNRDEGASDEQVVNNPDLNVSTASRSKSDKFKSSARPAAAEGEFQFPLVGCFATGSGCAMAKGLDVLDLQTGVLSLIHCHSVHLDLMKCTQVPTTKKPGTWLLKKADAAERAKLIQEEGQTVSADPGAMPIWSFMTMTLGFISDVDRNSEKWRWMGNARFTVYAVAQFLRGVPSFRSTIKYVPWQGKDCRGHDWGPNGDQPPKSWSGDGLQCTMDYQCECQKNRPSSDEGKKEEKQEGGEAAAGNEEEKWITIRDEETSSCGIQNMPYLGKEMIMAPFSHIADGSLDICHSVDVKSEKGKTGGRMALMSGMDYLENGSHIHKCEGLFVNVKAQKVLVEPHEGLVMSDGEVLDFHGYLLETDREGVDLIRTRLPTGGSHEWPKPKLN